MKRRLQDGHDSDMISPDSISSGPVEVVYPRAYQLGSYIKVVATDPKQGQQTGTRKKPKAHYAEIIDVRLPHNTLHERKRHALAEDYDYYVHFIGTNRRHDCWVQGRGSEPVGQNDPEVRRLKATESDEHSDHGGINVEAHNEATKVKTVLRISFGGTLVDVWYFSPFPAFYHQEVLHFCEVCLDFFRFDRELTRHRCPYCHPPGDEVWRDTTRETELSLFEVDGLYERVYCENLCFLGKLFLDHKTLQYDVTCFFFYVLGEWEKVPPPGDAPEGTEPTYRWHTVAYFSKEKLSTQEYNLACICTLPHKQKTGYGRLMISLSYALSRLENKRGTPEKPLSDLGEASYKSWWLDALLSILDKFKAAEDGAQVSLDDLSKMTGMKIDDIRTALEDTGILVKNGNTYFFDVRPQKIAKIKPRGIRDPHIALAQIRWTPLPDATLR